MKNRHIAILSLSVIIAFAALSPAVSEDMLQFKDGRIFYGKIVSVTKDNIEYIPEKEKKKIYVPRADVLKITYSNGTVVDVQENWGEKLDVKTLERGYFFGIIREDTTEPGLLPLLLRTGLIWNKGATSVKIYDKDEEEIAEGDAEFDQYQLKFSYEPIQSAFYLTPELGYFYRKVAVKDYSYSVESVNQGVEGFIPGIVTNPDTGETVTKDSVSSLAYTAKFHSFYLDLKGGYNLVFGFKSVQFILNPYLYTSLVDLRKSEFEFKLMDKKETYSRPWLFSFFSAFGAGCELGFYFPGLRSGIKAGYDFKYLRMFEISDRIKFKEVSYDEDLGVATTRENSAKYSSVMANLFTLEFFFFL